MTDRQSDFNDSAVAIIGMACKFPLGNDVFEYWRNLCAGVEAVRTLSDDELLKAGVSADTFQQKNYVRAASTIEGIEKFDAEFFGFSRREAEILDPQQRLLLECAYHALELAGYALGDEVRAVSRDVGVYVGTATSSYAYENIITHPDLIEAMGVMNVSIANEKDFVAAQLAYRLNLSGPAVNINTACSTSLVAVHHAVNALANYECNMALAGGATVRANQAQGYPFLEGGILSEDGHCRPFSAQADGTIDGNGAGLVLLKRLSDALHDGDCIHAVIEASAINNDGSDKMGITAPSVKGQARVIREAIAMADIPAQQIAYVEAHGTGTSIGDPIEVAALQDAFAASPSDRDSVPQQHCALGSVKSNMGHLDAAAGIAGLIKTALSVEHGKIPASLHVNETNPQINFTDSPFYVAKDMVDWPAWAERRFAGVSSFGIGGTNAHMIVAQEPPRQVVDAPQQQYLLSLSAKQPASLQDAVTALHAHLGDVNLPTKTIGDVCYSLSRRPDYVCRAAWVVNSIDDAIEQLNSTQVDNIQQSCLTQIEEVLSAQSQSCSERNNTTDQLCESARRWLAGDEVNVQSLFKAGTHRMMALPGYAFCREILWIEKQTPQIEAFAKRTNSSTQPIQDQEPLDAGATLYAYEWRSQPMLRIHQQSQRREPDSGNGDATLVFVAQNPAAQQLYQRDECIEVTQADEFAQISESQYQIAYHQTEHLAQLMQSLKRAETPIDCIEYLAFLDIPDKAVEHAEELLRWQKHLLDLVAWVKSIDQGAVRLPLLRVYLRNAFQIIGDEAVCPIARALAAMLVVVNQELAEFRVQVIDLVAQPDADYFRTVKAYLSDVYHSDSSQSRLAQYRDEVFYALRGKKLWMRHFRAMQQDESQGLSLDRDSTIVFTGGMGQVGQVACRHLAMVCKRLIIIGRSDPAEFDQATQSLFDRLQMINGGVEYRAVDLADEQAVRSCLNDVYQSYGQIHLLIHGAGDMRKQQLHGHDRCDEQTLQQQHHAKVTGSLAVVAATQEVEINSVVAISSLSASLGGLGMVAYAAANAFMDAIAERGAQATRWFSIDCDGLIGEKTMGKQVPGTEALINAEQLMSIVTLLISEYQPGLWILAQGDLNQRWQRSIKKAELDTSEWSDDNATYIADEEVEAELIALYETLTGYPGIQASDDFFSVGGDSVTATQLRMLIEKKFNVDISIEAIFDRPEINRLTDHIKSLRQADDADGDAELARLLEQIEGMNEVDMERIMEQG